MEMIPQGKVDLDIGTDHIRLVSLGGCCGPKLTFGEIGRGAEALPFDWILTKLEAILHFIRTDFLGFFEWVSMKPVTGSKMTMFRSRFHSFCHDDPDEPAMQEKYGRRMQRFNEIDANLEPVLFVRAVGTRQEVLKVPELLWELTSRFGKCAHLLLVIGFQKKAMGLACIRGQHNFLLVHLNAAAEGAWDTSYGESIKTALQWTAGKPVHTGSYDSLQEAFDTSDELGQNVENFDQTPLQSLPLPARAPDPKPCPDKHYKPHVGAPPCQKPDHRELLQYLDGLEQQGVVFTEVTHVATSQNVGITVRGPLNTTA